MFREMRRKKQQLTEAEALEILKTGRTGVLGVVGDGGWPYTVPVNYVWRNGKAYFHCAKAGHKLDAIRACGKVSLCVIEKDDIVPEALTTHYRSVILFGRARVLEDRDDIIRAAEALGRKYAPEHPGIRDEIAGALDRLCCVEITPEHITGKAAIELVNI